VINQGESKPTRIMYASNLSWNTLKKTLELLLKKDYIEEIQGSGSNKTYSITPQGINVLKFCEQIEELVNIET
jgi:predicted transcriptional regulator